MSSPERCADIHRVVQDRIDAGDRFAVAVVLKAVGSTPTATGTKAVIDRAGAIHRTIGGGALEAEAQRRAIQAIQQGRPCVFDFRLEGAGLSDQRPVCGGNLRVLIDPTAAPARAAYAAAAQARAERRRGVLLTQLEGSAPPSVTVCWFAEGTVPADVGFPGAGAIESALRSETPAWLTADADSSGRQIEVLVEPVIPLPLLLIAGGGHVGQAVAHQASVVGFEVMVIDDRPEFTDPGLYPASVATRCADVARTLAEFPVTPDTFIVLVTRGHQHDAAALLACLRRPVAYLGMIGSRRKIALVRRNFLAAGQVTADEFDRVYAPIGLDLGAVTVPEIGASIVAQLIAVRRTGTASRMPTF